MGGCMGRGYASPHGRRVMPLSSPCLSVMVAYRRDWLRTLLFHYIEDMGLLQPRPIPTKPKSHWHPSRPVHMTAQSHVHAAWNIPYPKEMGVTDWSSVKMYPWGDIVADVLREGGTQSG